jgi:hypothetical protein
LWNWLFAQPVHPRDRRLRFDERTHTYFIDGQRGKMISVTGIVHRLFPVFDADQAIASMRKGRKWNPQHPMYLKSNAEIKQAWEDNRNNAASMGTQMHAHLEHLFKSRIAGVPFTQTLSDDLLRKPHLDAFLAAHTHLVPYRLEWSLFDKGLQLAGTIDALFLDTRVRVDSATNKSEPSEQMTFVMVDWKRSKRIDYENHFQHGLPGTPVEHLDDCNVVRYTLQLNTYKRLLETRYNVRISEMFLVVFHPDQEDFLKVPIDPVPELIDEIFELRRQQLLVSNSLTRAH